MFDTQAPVACQAVPGPGARGLSGLSSRSDCGRVGKISCQGSYERSEAVHAELQQVRHITHVTQGLVLRLRLWDLFRWMLAQLGSE